MQRRSVLLACLLTFATPAFATPAFAASPPQTHSVAAWAQRRATAIKRTFTDPKALKKLAGKSTLWFGALGVGQVVDVALMMHGVPPLVSMSAGFVSSALPTAAQYPVQKALAKKLPAWFDAPEHRTAWELTKDSAFAGVVGVAGGAAVTAAGSTIQASVPIQKIVTPLLHSGGKSLHAMTKPLVQSVQWASSQYANQKVSDASDKAREKAADLGRRIRDFLVTKRAARSRRRRATNL